ncbi:hypothetical protein CK203_049477 [Vitis vinifera]|uniref:Uncharacterized protein n=1 Tax=Vitis vinifera TaxID=29760 RepID=A0A438HAT2_VITVI|nr:hypothetical protein CK203_049477 [Vitis vinifera]
MMVMIFSEYIEIRLLQLRASIVIERSSRSSDAFIATLDFIDTLLWVPHIHGLAHIQCSSSIPHPFHWLRRHDLRPSFGALRSLQFLRIDFLPHRRCRRHFSDLSAPLSRVFETLQAMGFLAPLAPRALPDPVPPQFRLDLYCVPSVECEEFEPRVDLAWRGISYDLWVVYDMWIGRLLDETVTYFVREVQTQLERTLFHQGADPRGRCMVDGFRWKPILRANQCGSAKEASSGPWLMRFALYMLHFIYEGMSFDHWVFEPSFLSFLSPYNLGLRYVPCLKTTLRPWDQMSSSAASTWAVVFGLLGSLARSLSLIGCSLRRGRDRYLTEPRDPSS